jgi:glutathione synthase/RimK-type ligase-like ATP-grasp enzyme
MPTPRYLLIANPTTKRCATYHRELLAFWANRHVTPEIVVVPWADVIPRDGQLDHLPAFDRPAVLRLESPGKDDGVTRLLLEAGARDDPTEPPCDWRLLPMPKGLLLRPGLYYRGFRRVLQGLARAFASRSHLTPTASPLAVIEMFDKTVTTVKLHAAGVPVPNWLPNPRDVFVEIEDSESRQRWHTVYLKLNTGSSATGIIAVRSEQGKLHGMTTLAEIGGRFFNSRRLLHLTGSALERAAHFLLKEGAFAQQGIAMSQIDGQNFDVRVVCVYGRPVASIFRLSSAPMTNLQLGGRRGDFARCRDTIPTRDWLDALDHCAEASGCFESAIAGVDLVFERGSNRHFVLEVNAFGDFFPGWINAEGQSVHAREIEETIGRVGS